VAEVVLRRRLIGFPNRMVARELGAVGATVWRSVPASS
jgi:hypothetical protein